MSAAFGRRFRFYRQPRIIQELDAVRRALNRREQVSLGNVW